MRRSLPLLALALLALCAAVTTPARGQVDADAWLRDVARGYRAYGRVDDELRWAPWLCRLPFPSRARVSRAAAAHGRKVYFVYASDRGAYLGLTRTDERAPPVGFTVVKEAFAPRRVTPDELGEHGPFDTHIPIPGAPPRTTGGAGLGGLGDGSPNVYRPLQGEDGALTGAGAPRGLYVLRYLGPDAPDTDAGWVYGTLDADGAVTGRGRIGSCMGCHRDAPHGRLFGLDGP